MHAHTHTSCTDVEGACFVAVYWSERDNDQCEATPYVGTIIAMGDADAQHLGVLAPQQRPSSTAIIQYKDCSAEFLDLALLSAVGSPCTEACNECCGSKSTVVPAAGRRRMWLLKEFDTDAIRAKRHTLDAEPTTSMAPRESKGQGQKQKQRLPREWLQTPCKSSWMHASNSWRSCKKRRSSAVHAKHRAVQMTTRH